MPKGTFTCPLELERILVLVFYLEDIPQIFSTYRNIKTSLISGDLSVGIYNQNSFYTPLTGRHYAFKIFYNPKIQLKIQTSQINGIFEVLYNQKSFWRCFRPTWSYTGFFLKHTLLEYLLQILYVQRLPRGPLYKKIHNKVFYTLKTFKTSFSNHI